RGDVAVRLLAVREEVDQCRGLFGNGHAGSSPLVGCPGFARSPTSLWYHIPRKGAFHEGLAHRRRHPGALDSPQRVGPAPPRDLNLSGQVMRGVSARRAERTHANSALAGLSRPFPRYATCSLDCSQKGSPPGWLI